MSRVATLDMRTVPGPVPPGGAAEVLPWPGLPELSALDAGEPEFADRARGSAHTLPEGMRLLDYDIVGPIGEGGFGIVYLAWDDVLERHVAIKEFLPAALASRASVSPAVIVKSRRHLEGFRAGMRGFVQEAQLLARFDHPALVRVLRFWEGNGTAYMAMPYYEGPTLAQALEDLGRPPTEQELMGWLRPLLDALGTLHAAHCFHRDIAPDNILLTDDGPVLLDFGAARRVIGELGPAPTVVYKPGFAPVEQYGQVASMKQGAWTDVYALAAVVYAAIAGKPPTPSVERLMDDRLAPLSELARGRYSPGFLAAIDDALALHPRNRPRSAAAFLARLEAGQPRAGALLGWLARPRTLLAAGVLGLIGALLAGVYLAGRQAGPGDRGPVAAPVPAPAAVAPPAISAPPAVPAPSAARSGAAPAAGKTRPPAKALAPLSTEEADRILRPLPAPKPLDLREAPRAVPAPVPVPVPDAAPGLAPRSLAEPVAESAAPAPAPAAAPAAARRKAARAAPSTAAEAETPQARAPAREPAREPGTRAANSARCTELLQRASLEPLGPRDAAFLRKECE